jgi:2-dehydropantoate 2-reductase
LDAIRKKGLLITGFRELVGRCERVAHGVAELSSYPVVDTIIVATKASVMPYIAPELEKVNRPGMRFICCQNGLDNEEFLAETFGRDKVLRIVVNYAGSQMGDGSIHMSFFNPPNYIGALTAEGEGLARTLGEMATGAELETRFTNDVKKYAWEKTILNSALNPVCALTRKPMRDMMDLEFTQSLSAKLLQEGVAVAKAVGIDLDDGFLEAGIQYLKKAGYHRTSMHQDVLRRAPTEIDWINSRIVEWGRTCGVETPYNFAITALIKGLEMKSKAPE